MALQLQAFDHQTPAAPTLRKGMLLGASGVSAPPLQTVGTRTSVSSSANGDFADILGKGQIAYDSSGRMYVGNTSNNRVDRFTKNASGIWVWDSSCSALNALGANVSLELVAIDLSRNQIHLASSAQNAAGFIGVWDLGLWPGLTTLNRNRSYGTQSGSNGSGNARTAMCLTLIGDFAIVCSSAGDYRVLKINHVTNTLVAEDTNTLWKARFSANADGSKYYSGAQASDTELGLWLMNTATLVGSSRLDSGSPAGVNYTRRNNLVQGVGGDIVDTVYYNGRIFVRLLRAGRVVAFRTSDDLFDDEFLWAGGMGASECFGHAPGDMFSPQIQQAKLGVVVGGDSQSDDLVAWSSNAQNTSQQSFLTVWPMSTALATWSKSDWSTGTNTIKRIVIQGTNLSGEKFKLRLRKNSGDWVTVLPSQLRDEAILASAGTLTQGNTLDVELNLNAFERQDGHATAKATRDKLTPTNVSLDLVYEDTAGDVYVPYASGALKAKFGGQGAFKGRLGG